MHRVQRFFQYSRRSGLVLLAVAVPIGIIGKATAHPPTVITPLAVSLSGTHFNATTFIPHNEQLGNASIQAVTIQTSDAALNDIITSAVNTRVQNFQAALPSTPAVSGFFHQLRVVPRVDYSAGNLESVTLETDEYHPSGVVSVHFESWLSSGGTVTQPVLSTAMAVQFARALHVPEKTLLAQVGTPIAMGLLPNYKIRLYASGAMASYVSVPYKDISFGRLPEAVKNYHNSYFATYPEHLSPTMQTNLDKVYSRALSRSARPTDCTRDACVALTFDDGPDPALTPLILDILKANSVNATFFALGSQIQRSPDLAKRVAAEGNEVENHTFNHPDLVKLRSPELIRKQIDDTEKTFESVGLHAQFLRPPYGSVNDGVRAAANMPLILWNVDAQEWRPGTTPEMMAASLVNQTRPGAIILMHDTKEITVGALPLVIDQLKARNFRFVTVAQLLQIDGNARGTFASK